MQDMAGGGGAYAKKIEYTKNCDLSMRSPTSAIQFSIILHFFAPFQESVYKYIFNAGICMVI